jgi:hypothetical protein
MLKFLEILDDIIPVKSGRNYRIQGVTDIELYHEFSERFMAKYVR